MILSMLFLLTAILYSSVGFGGGSTYLALLLIWGVPYFIFPIGKDPPIKAKGMDPIK